MPHRHTPSRHTAAGGAFSEGFTLIELLVVISIIALLIAILLPALRAARTSAKLMKAGSQVRQLQIAVHAYANDYDDVLPPTADDDSAPYWTNLLVDGGYLAEYRTGSGQAPEIFFSPDHDRSLNPTFRFSGFGATGWGAMAISNRKNIEAAPARQHDVRGPAPAKVMTLVDVSNFASNNGLTDGLYDASSGNSNIFTYNGAAARSYLDGHVSTGRTGNSAEGLYWQANGQRNGNFLAHFTGAGRKTKFKEPWYGRHSLSEDPWD